MTKLTLKQQRFADEYIISGNATDAAVKAGYSKKYANTNASKLLQNTTIKSYIDERLADLQSQKVADQQEVMEYLTAVMRGEKTEPLLVLDGEGTQKVVNAVPPVQARTKAAELLGKRYRLFTDKVELDATVEQVVFEDDIS
ncbi:MAG: terminase small subunit [Streptococcus lutetiensis]|nr:terminase small subunit [Streptococcus lutetiensis]MDU6825017.1 terminase small subunit [Streptococcus lutetiensis]MDU6892517.1 terminase small subunit [Streptococcus lutetiensis]NHG91263.1 terminase small subunit [Campylobacter jejuni]